MQGLTLELGLVEMVILLMKVDYLNHLKREVQANLIHLDLEEVVNPIHLSLEVEVIRLNHLTKVVEEGHLNCPMKGEVVENLSHLMKVGVEVIFHLRKEVVEVH